LYSGCINVEHPLALDSSGFWQPLCGHAMSSMMLVAALVVFWLY
jgi:hypothetical protein